MRSEEELRNSRDNTDEKLMAVLEYYTDCASALFEAINDPSFSTEDVKKIWTQ